MVDGKCLALVTCMSQNPEHDPTDHFRQPPGSKFTGNASMVRSGKPSQGALGDPSGSASSQGRNRW
jgi:hypothetical protein